MVSPFAYRRGAQGRRILAKIVKTYGVSVPRYAQLIQRPQIRGDNNFWNTPIIRVGYLDRPGVSMIPRAVQRLER